jgi:hypothetical protein
MNRIDHSNDVHLDNGLLHNCQFLCHLIIFLQNGLVSPSTLLALTHQLLVDLRKGFVFLHEFILLGTCDVHEISKSIVLHLKG